mmetsp:Transcript_20010/g.43306  ORF Transcript_20010/g.43306 Transcript_20010/m.43306 type:complete len:508 (-) Transcript_20010:46-1569(-)
MDRLAPLPADDDSEPQTASGSRGVTPGLAAGFRRNISSMNPAGLATAGINKIPSNLGIDVMADWIQTSLFASGGTRGALFSVWDGRRRTVQMLFVVSVMAGLATAITQYYFSPDPNAIQGDWYDNFMKWITIGFWVLAVIFWYRLVCIRTRLHALRNYRDKEVSAYGFSERLERFGWSPLSWHRASLFWPAIFDFLIFLPQPIPGMNIPIPIYSNFHHEVQVYGLDSIMLMLMFLRFYFLPRALCDFSRLSSFQARSIANLNFVDITPGMVLRAYLGSSIIAVCVTFLVLICVFAFMMVIAEAPLIDSMLHHNFSNCLWLIIITMTTVGYGDVYPTTFLGRGVAVLAAFAAVICMALFVNLATQRLTLAKQEERVVAVVDRMDLSKELRSSAASLMQNLWRAYAKRIQKFNSSRSSASTPLLKSNVTSITFDKNVAAAVNSFRDLRRDYLSDCIELENQVALSKIQHQISTHITNLQGQLADSDTHLRTLRADIFSKLDEIQRQLSK